jgi:uncharacterized protein
VLAKNIVEFRDANGPFPNRSTMRKVPRMGEKTFEQAAGFLRVNNGDNPLDRSAVHPEAYPVVERILARLGKSVTEVMGQPDALSGLAPAEFTDEKFGVPTVRDILAELEKPGRDPRPEFKTATFREGIESIADLAPDMILEGVVTNVAAFGAFVDIGVHQDGLVHVSALANRFVKDPHDVVKPGQIVQVKVIEVDVKRQRIALTMRINEANNALSRSAAPGAGAAREPRERRPTENKGAPSAGAPREARERRPTENRTAPPSDAPREARERRPTENRGAPSPGGPREARERRPNGKRGPGPGTHRPTQDRQPQEGKRESKREPEMQSAMALAFAKLKK